MFNRILTITLVVHEHYALVERFACERLNSGHLSGDFSWNWLLVSTVGLLSLFMFCMKLQKEIIHLNYICGSFWTRCLWMCKLGTFLRCWFLLCTMLKNILIHQMLAITVVVRGHYALVEREACGRLNMEHLAGGRLNMEHLAGAFSWRNGFSV